MTISPSNTPALRPPGSAEPPLCATGVEGLDDILEGGLTPNRLYLVQGDPGVGKTTLALQFLMEGVKNGEKCLYITLSETKNELQTVARSHGWSLEGIDLFDLTAVADSMGGEEDNTFFHPSEVELNRTIQALLAEVERVNPSRVVFDSLSEMRLLAETSLRYRRQVLQFKQHFSGRNTTVLFLDDKTAERHDLQLESIAHGVIRLTRTLPDYGIARRQLEIQKIRGRKFREGHHDFMLRTGGMVVFPRLVAAEHHSTYEMEAFPSGLPELDALVGGGLDRGTSSMFMGAPGTGKSTLALHFAMAAARKGEKSLIFIFDETVRNFVTRTKKLGMDLEPHIEKGTIILRQIDPAEISPGELAYQIARAVQRDDVRMVIIDSINGYLNAMPAERYLNLQLHELLSFLNQQGVVTIMVLAQQGVVNTTTTVDLTYLADAVFLLQYYEEHGRVKQAMSVIKKRTGNHERTLREIWVGSRGIEVGPPLTHMQGVLTGVPQLLAHDSGKSTSARGKS